MSNENDDATQLGSIGRHMSKPQQPGNPQARPAFQAPSLPTHPQEQDGDEEGTVLSTHNATHYAANTFDADEEGTVLSTHNATPSRPTAYGSNGAAHAGATDAIRSNTTAATTIAIGSRNGNAPIPADYGTKRQARAAGHGFFHDVRAAGRHHRIP